MGDFKQIQGAGGGKSGGKQRTPIEAPDSLRSTAFARVLDLVGEGEIYGFADDANPMSCVLFNETPVTNADGSYNFKNVQIDSRTGTQTQDYMRGFPGVENEGLVNVQLQYGTPWTRAVNNLNVTAVRVRISTPQFAKTNTTNGDINGTTVQYRIEIATDGGPFVTKLNGTMTGKCTSKYERSHLMELPPATGSGWVIRVTRLTADSSSSALVNQTYIESFAEIIEVKLRMPMSALVGVIIDAEQFNNIPTRGYRLKGRIIKVPTNYDPVTRVYTGIWDGTFKTAYCNNPAWVFYDMAINTRYGLGKLLTSDLVDKWNLYKIAQYCDVLVDDGFGGQEPRFTCNLFLQTQNDALRVMQDLASVFRGIMYAAGSSITAVSDQPDDVQYIYTPANVLEGRFVYSGSSRRVRHTVALVSWNDMSDMCRAKIEYVDDPEGIERFGYQPTEVIAIGCTSRGQARRLGKYLLATERYETDAVTFGVGFDGVLVAPGKIIKIADPLRAGKRRGGRIHSAGANYIVADMLPAGVVAGDKITAILPSGKAEQRTVSTVVGNQVNMTANFSAIPVAQSMWLVESSTVAAQTFRVVGVTLNKDANGFVIEALQHVEGKIELVEQGLQIEEPSISDIPAKMISSVASVTFSQRDVADANTTGKVVGVSWPSVPGAAKYALEYRNNAGSWIDIGSTSGTHFDIGNVQPGDIDVQVTAITSAGVRAQPKFAGPYTVNAVALAPGFVAGLNADIADALTAAENAQATADGVIDTFWQNSPPTGAKEGDVWYDTDDGNKIYRWHSGSWVYSPDDRIAQAIANAATAQSTADGKVKLFVGSTAPVSGYQLNDLWFNTTTKQTYRYNGTDWNTPVADVTLDQLGGTGVNLMPDQYSTMQQTTLPTFDSFAVSLARDTSVLKFQGSLLITTTTSGSDHYVVFAAPGVYNIPRTAGKKYLVSFFYITGSGGTSDLLLRDSGGSHPYATSTWTAIGDNQWHRATVAMDPSSFTGDYMHLRIDYDVTTNGATCRIEGVMVEEMIGTKVVASTYSRGSAAGLSISALLAAQTAQATADGVVDIYHQASPPSIGGVNAKLGDYWQDTDDGKWYYCNGSSWVESTDSRLPQVVTDLQTTNGVVAVKTRLFYQESQPTATANGDMWYQPSTTITRYWNGTGWSLQADNSMVTQATQSLVVDGGFEAGGYGWGGSIGTNKIYVEASSNAAIVGTKGLVINGVNAAGAYYDAYCATFPVQTTESFVIECFVQNIGSPGDTGALVIWWYDLNGTYITATEVGRFANRTVISGSNWGKVTGGAKPPSGAMFARAGVAVAGMTAGYWCCDQFRAFKHTKGEPRPCNMLPGSNFGGLNGDFTPPWYIASNANGMVTPNGLRNKKYGLSSGSTWTIDGNTGVLELYQDGIISGSGIYLDVGCGSGPASLIPVTAGQRYEMHCKTANHRTKTMMYVFWLNSAQAGLSTNQTAESTGAGGGGKAEVDYEQIGAFVTAPAGAAYARIFFRRYNTDPGQANSYTWWIKPYFGPAGSTQTEFSAWQEGPLLAADEISTVNFGVVSNTDLYDGGGTRRMGLRVKGSRHTLGGARNSRANMVQGITSVRTATALTATSAGVVNVNAHSLEISGETVAYSAVSSAVTGLTQGVSYIIYTLDPYLDGGVRTYYAQTSQLSAQQAGEGAVVMGNVTIPTSGSSGGGGGGGGFDPCVTADMWINDRLIAAHAQPGDIFDCLNLPTGTNKFQRPLDSVEYSWTECVTIVTDKGAELDCSVSTPFDLVDGRMTWAPHMLGEMVVTDLGIEQVVEVREIGVQLVCHNHLGGVSYAAGRNPKHRIYSHNPYKP